MFRSEPDLTAIELQRLEQAKRLHKGVIESCLIVEGVIFYVAILFLFNAQPFLAATWLVATSLMVFMTFLYARLRAPEGITRYNFEEYLKGHIWVSSITGLMWSGFAIYQLDAESLLSLFLGFTIVTSITLGGLFPNSAYRATYVGLLTTCVLPLAIYWFVTVDGPMRFFALGLGFYYAFGLVSSARTEINMRDLLLAQQAEKLAEKLKTENAIFEQANIEKTQFMVATVHDFSQPLHAQGYFIHALRNLIEDRGQLELLDRIESSWRSQGELLQGIGDIVRFDGGLIKPNLMPVNLEKALENIASEFREAAERKHITFECQLTPIVVKTDPALLARVVRNLLSNAFKFTPEAGAIELSNYENHGRVNVEVKDSGPGIAPRDQQRIFDEYVQLEQDSAAPQRGLGLGLSIVERLAKALHIELTLTSDLGAGSTFSLSMPGYPKYAPAPMTELDQISLSSSPLIVLVDDEQDIRDGMTALLQSMGCDVVSAATGADVIIELSETERLPSLLIVDNRLSENEIGLDLIVRLRDEVNLTVPAILMTGDVDSLEGVDLGPAVTMLAKPVDPNQLSRFIEELDQDGR
jgi:signal transduction histidine kinase/CheY-like chemotaxis protein